MSIHQNLSQLSVSVIDEHIELARIALDARKPDGGCLGYPAFLLMLCVIDAVSNHLGHSKNSLGAIDGNVFKLNLNRRQRKQFKEWYRNYLAHNAMIPPGTLLTAEDDGEPVELRNGEPVKIRLIPLLHVVEEGWNSLDKAKIQGRNISPPNIPLDLTSLNLSSPISPSGCVVPRKARPKRYLVIQSRGLSVNRTRILRDIMGP